MPIPSVGKGDSIHLVFTWGANPAINFNGQKLSAEVSTSFIEVLARQKRLLLVGDLVQISEDLFNTVAERVHAGKVAPIEETNAQIALSNVQIQRQRVMRDLESARKKLAAAWGSTVLDFKQVRN